MALERRIVSFRISMECIPRYKFCREKKKQRGRMHSSYKTPMSLSLFRFLCFSCVAIKRLLITRFPVFSIPTRLQNFNPVLESYGSHLCERLFYYSSISIQASRKDVIKTCQAITGSETRRGSLHLAF
jgi:hypothetical protein